MLKNIIKSNLIAIAIHLCVCIVVLVPVLIVLYTGNGRGSLWSDGVWEWWSLRAIVWNSVRIGICTLIALFLYFLAGRIFLTNTGHLLTNALSVIAIPLLMIMAMFISLYLVSIFILGLMGTPIMLIGETISFFLRIELKYAYMIMSPLPPLAVWLGLVTNRSKY